MRIIHCEAAAIQNISAEAGKDLTRLQALYARGTGNAALDAALTVSSGRWPAEAYENVCKVK